MKNAALFMVALSGVLASFVAVCEEASLEQLRQRCEEARELKLAPLREDAIEECVSNRRATRSRQDCERIYRDFGEGHATVTGGFRVRMFNDLPECLEFYEADDRLRSSESRR